MTKFSIEEYEAEAIRIYFRSEALITLYSYSVTVPYSVFLGCLFRQDCVIVALEYFDRFCDIIDSLEITPRTDLNLNKEYFDRIL